MRSDATTRATVRSFDMSTSNFAGMGRFWRIDGDWAATYAARCFDALA